MNLTPDDMKRLSYTELLDACERMHQALDAVLSYSKNTNEDHADHDGLAQCSVDGEGCILCVIEGVALYGLGEGERLL